MFKYRIVGGKAIICVTYYPESYLSIPSSIDGCPVTEIAAYSFISSSVEHVFIPATLVTIGEGAFEKCRYLTHVLMSDDGNPNRAKKLRIMDRAFFECSALESITSLHNMDVHTRAFFGCENLLEVKATINGVAVHAFDNCQKLKKISFANNAFWRNNSFNGCQQLSEIVFSGTPATYMSKPELLEVLRDRTIICPPTFGWIDLYHEGYDIKVI